jgi:hypothetical protein
LEEGGAFIDDTMIDLKTNHVHIGDSNEDDFVHRRLGCEEVNL